MLALLDLPFSLTRSEGYFITKRQSDQNGKMSQESSLESRLKQQRNFASWVTIFYIILTKIRKVNIPIMEGASQFSELVFSLFPLNQITDLEPVKHRSVDILIANKWPFLFVKWAMDDPCCCYGRICPLDNSLKISNLLRQ